MNDFLVAILCAVACSLLWGVAYSALQPVSAVLRPETISFMYSGFNTVIFGVVILVRDGTSDFSLLTEPLIESFALYAVLAMLALFLYLTGYKFVGTTYAGGFNAITSTYPVIVFLISYFYFKQKNFNLYLAIPGVTLTAVGIILLSLAPTS